MYQSVLGHSPTVCGHKSTFTAFLKIYEPLLGFTQASVNLVTGCAGDVDDPIYLLSRGKTWQLGVASHINYYLWSYSVITSLHGDYHLM